MKVQTIHLVAAVMHNGQMMTQINASFGDELELEGTHFIRVTPNPSKGKPVYLVPLTNVKALVPLTEAMVAKAQIAEAVIKAAAVPLAAKRSHASVLSGTIKLVKNPETGAIEEKMV
jgi:hypothetical protein